jgi:hypothetical protein
LADSRIERERQKALSGVVDRSVPCVTDGSAALLLTTTTITTYPSIAGSFFASNPTEIDGTEVEGGLASYTADATQVVYALNVGTKIPPVGTHIVASSVGGRWVFRYDG